MVVGVERSPSLEHCAAGLGVKDALLFRRVSKTTWVHLGGIGRGRGWAGLIDVAAENDPLLATMPDHPGGIYRFTYEQAGRVLGPYYAVGGALVRVSNDVAVVLANPDSPLPAAASNDALRQLAVYLETAVDDVAPSKRLADELEVLHAVQAITTGPADDLAGTLQHVVDIAVESLSCEVGILRDGSARTAATSSWPGVDVDDPRVDAALDFLADRAGGGSLCIQDTDEEPILAPLGREHGVRSLLAVSIPAPVGGILVVAHTSAGPRGFTTLCQQLGRHVADAAATIAHTAALREELREAVDAHTRAARRDPLTGLGNRLAWDEALVVAQQQVDAGESVTVVTLDIDGLKVINDTCGHEAGDDLLQRCADVLRQHTQRQDICVRLGGDEFAVLMPHVDSFAGHRGSTLAQEFGGVTSCDLTVAASIGTATAHPGGSVVDAVREADVSMYAAKRHRRLQPREAEAAPASG